MSMEKIAEEKVRVPLDDEAIVDEGEVLLQLSGIAEEWPFMVTEGRYPISGYISGRVLIGINLPTYPDAGLVWTDFPEEGRRIHQIWVADDLRRIGVAKTLTELYRKHYGKPEFVGPFSPSGEAFVATLSKLKSRLLRI